MKKINIQKEANIHAEGNLFTGNCDPCIILENGMVFTSQVDLAEYLGVTAAAVSSTVCGRQRTCKGYHIVSVSRLTEGVDVILSRLRETAAVEDDAKKWREYQEEQEAIRKAEEERRKKAAKLNEELEKFVAERERYQARLDRCDNEMARIKMELELLNGNGKEAM